MRWTAKGNTEISLKGTPEEIDAVEAMLMGACYVGNPEAPREPKPVLRAERFEDVKVTVDPEMQKFYPWWSAGQTQLKVSDGWGREVPFELASYKIGDFVRGAKDKDGKDFFSPHIYVTSVGAGGKAIEYTRRCELLKAAGFDQLRSPREADGRYWEVWILHFLPFSYTPDNPVLESVKPNFDYEPDVGNLTFQEREELMNKWEKEELPKLKPTLDHYMKWLCREIRPGSIEVSVQRAALCFADL